MVTLYNMKRVGYKLSLVVLLRKLLRWVGLLQLLPLVNIFTGHDPERVVSDKRCYWKVLSAEITTY